MTWHGILSDQQPVKVGGVEWSYTIAKQNKMKVVVWSHTIEWSGAFFLFEVESFQTDSKSERSVSNVFQPGFFLPTGPTKPLPSGSGKPDRFERLPKNRSNSNFKPKWQFNWFPPVSQPVMPVNWSGLSGNRSV